MTYKLRSHSEKHQHDYIPPRHLDPVHNEPAQSSRLWLISGRRGGRPFFIGSRCAALFPMTTKHFVGWGCDEVQGPRGSNLRLCKLKEKDEESVC
jgi:hypothetical protein